MSNTFLIADPHYGHKAATELFTKDCGTKLRPFASIEECDQALEERHNKVVKPCDKVYFLGDIVMPKNKSSLEILSRLNGTKVLIKGNHDQFEAREYLKYFKDIRGSHMLDKLVMTHIPIHPHCLTRWRGNIHGHLHSNTIKNNLEFGSQEDSRYFCVSVEQIDFTPISFETVNKIFKDRGL
jgi:calcineurin-like phosphoesterase family protein